MKKLTKKEFTIKFLKEKIEKITGKKVIFKEEISRDGDGNPLDLNDFIQDLFMNAYKNCMQNKAAEGSLENFWNSSKKQILNGVKKYYNFEEENLGKLANIFKQWLDLTWKACIENKGSKQGYDEFMNKNFGKIFHAITSLSAGEVEKENLKSKGDSW